MDNTTQSTQDSANSANSVQQAPVPNGWDNPMLHRNNLPEGVPPTPVQETPKAQQEVQPEVKTSSPEPQVKTQQEQSSDVVKRASAMDALGSFSEDPQFKPIAMYLDAQLKDVDTTRAFGKALEYGNLDLIDKAYLTEQLGSKADEIIQLSRSLFEGASAKAASEVNSLYQQFGGKETVDQAIRFFNERGDQAERTALGNLLDSGIKENIAYAMKQIVQFSTKAGGVAQANNVIPIGQPSAEKGLSAEEYREAIRALTRGNPNPSNLEFERLAKARQLGAQQGL